MKRLIVVLVFVLGICFVPDSTQFSAIAGRTMSGGAYCECGQPAPPVCLDDQYGLPCSTEGQGQLAAQMKDDSLSQDIGSAGLLIVTALYLLRRLI